MYKYSKKAETRFFENPIMAFCFIKFAESLDARNMVLHKLMKSEDNDVEMQDEEILNHNNRQ